jgi:hypothetical protein
MFEVAIRDDDTNHFTTPAQLEHAYGDLWGEVPISLAVVPEHGCTRTPAVPQQHWTGTERFPIAANEELVEFLNEGVDAGRVSIMQHGYDHVRTAAGPEFVAAGDFDDRVRRGRATLEALFDVPVDIVVPPNNAFSAAGLQEVKAAGMATFYYPTPFGRRPSPAALRAVMRDLRFKRAHSRGGTRGFLADAVAFWLRGDRTVPMPIRPWSYTVDGAPEFTAISLTGDRPVTPILRNIELAAVAGGKLCLAVHYHSFTDPAFRAKVEAVIEHAAAHGATFVHAHRLFEPEARGTP